MAQNEKVIISVELRDKGVTTGSKKAKDSIDGLTDAQKRLDRATKEAAFQESKQGRALADLEIRANLAKKANRELAIQTLKTAEATKQGKTQTGLNNAILVEAGRAASDFQYGMQGMANNIGQLSTLMGQHIQTQGGFIASMKELAKSFFGIQGVLIGVQLFISFLPQIEKWYKKINKEGLDLNKVFKDAASTVSDTAADFDIYLSVLKDSSKSQEQHLTAVNKLTEDFPKYIKMLKKAGLSLEDVKNNTDEARKAEELYRKEIIKTARVNAAKEAIQEQEAAKLQKNIDTTNKLRKLGFKSIEEAREKLAEKEEKAGVKLAKTIEERNEQIREEGRMYQHNEKIRAESLTTRDREVSAILGGLDRETEAREKNIEQLLKFVDIEGTQLPRRKQTALEVNKIGEKTVDDQEKVYDQLVGLQETHEETRLDKARKFADKLKDAQSVLGDIAGLATGFIDAEIQAEEAKTVKINNELRERLNNENLSAEERKKIQLKIAANDAAAAKKKDKLAEKQFKIDKALRISGALVETYSSAVRAYASQIVPFDPTSIIRAKIAAGVATAFGLANVAMIAKQKFVPTATTAPALDSGAAGGGETAVQPPSFNIVGSSGVNQLSDAISEAEKQPTRAYVVASDVTTAQELDRNIIESASL